MVWKCHDDLTGDVIDGEPDQLLITLNGAAMRSYDVAAAGQRRAVLSRLAHQLLADLGEEAAGEALLVEPLPVAAGRVGSDPNPACRVCGCTDTDCLQCVQATGEACWWTEVDLCSRCAPVAAMTRARPEPDPPGPDPAPEPEPDTLPAAPSTILVDGAASSPDPDTADPAVVGERAVDTPVARSGPDWQGAPGAMLAKVHGQPDPPRAVSPLSLAQLPRQELRADPVDLDALLPTADGVVPPPDPTGRGRHDGQPQDGDAKLRAEALLLDTDEVWTPKRVADETGLTLAEARAVLAKVRREQGKGSR